MKLNKIVLPLVLALAAALSTTACRHGFNGKVTTLPGQRAEAIPETGPGSTLPPGGQLPPPDNSGGIPGGAPGTGAGTLPGGGPLPENWDPSMMNQDRDKLAAYTIHFKFDSAVIPDSEQANLASVGQSLAGDPNARLLIEGNCDERGTEEYNRSLGERRALAAREALARIGVDPARIRTISYGKDKPVDPGHDEAAWSKNRNDQFIYCTPKSGPLQ
jgi:peptidoglycan-associated lipoprotein